MRLDAERAVDRGSARTESSGLRSTRPRRPRRGARRGVGHRRNDRSWSERLGGPTSTRIVAIVRYTSAGELDPTSPAMGSRPSTSARQDIGFGAVVQPDGKIVAVATGASDVRRVRGRETEPRRFARSVVRARTESREHDRRPVPRRRIGSRYALRRRQDRRRRGQPTRRPVPGDFAVARYLRGRQLDPTLRERRNRRDAQGPEDELVRAVSLDARRKDRSSAAATEDAVSRISLAAPPMTEPRRDVRRNRDRDDVASERARRSFRRRDASRRKGRRGRWTNADLFRARSYNDDGSLDAVLSRTAELRTYLVRTRAVRGPVLRALRRGRLAVRPVEAKVAIAATASKSRSGRPRLALQPAQPPRLCHSRPPRLPGASTSVTSLASSAADSGTVSSRVWCGQHLARARARRSARARLRGRPCPASVHARRLRGIVLRQTPRAGKRFESRCAASRSSSAGGRQR